VLLGIGKGIEVNPMRPDKPFKYNHINQQDGLRKAGGICNRSHNMTIGN